MVKGNQSTHKPNQSFDQGCHRHVTYSSAHLGVEIKLVELPDPAQHLLVARGHEALVFALVVPRVGGVVADLFDVCVSRV